MSHNLRSSQQIKHKEAAEIEWLRNQLFSLGHSEFQPTSLNDMSQSPRLTVALHILECSLIF